MVGMQYMRTIIKTSLFALWSLVDLGLRVVHARPKRVLILMYHSVEDSLWKYGVTAKDFKRQMAYIKKYFTVVSLEQVVRYAKGELDLPDKSVAITLDDGYADTYHAVFPIIKKQALPLTVFLTTDLSPKKVLGNLSRITWDQVKEMAESGAVQFEAHGHTHQNVKDLHADDASLRQEVLDCKKMIEDQTKKLVHYFAYPAGHRDKHVQEFLKNNGFEGACGITEGLIKVGDDPFALKRVQIDRTMNFLLFRLRLTGGIDLHRRSVDVLRKLYAPKH